MKCTLLQTKNIKAIKGGAVYQDYGGSFICNVCTFEKNIAGGYGGALFSEDRNSQTEGIPFQSE